MAERVVLKSGELNGIRWEIVETVTSHGRKYRGYEVFFETLNQRRQIQRKHVFKPHRLEDHSAVLNRIREALRDLGEPRQLNLIDVQYREIE